MRILFLVTIFLFPLSSQAYNAVGHIIVAEVAYDLLDETQQSELDRLANIIKETGDNSSLYRTFRGVSTFSKTAFLADRVATQPIGEVYASFNAALPASLKDYADKTTAAWHRALPSLAGCDNPMVTEENLETGVMRLTTAYRETKDDRARAVTLAILTALVADAHQPLRTTSTDLDHAQSSCKNDNGGLDFCIVERETDAACPAEKNLFTFWDNAAFSMNDPKKLHQYVRRVNKFAASIDAEKVSPDVSAWIADSRAMANEVYNTPVNEWPSRGYERKAQRTSAERMALAALNLKALIESL